MSHIKMLMTCTATVIGLALQAQEAPDGQELLELQRYQSAEVHFHEKLKSDPTDEEAWLGLTRAYLRQDDAATALDSLEKAPADVKEEYEWMVARGGALLAMNRTQEANTLFEQCMEKTKYKNADLLAAIARWHVVLDNGDPNKAIEILDKAMKRAKKNPEIYYLQGRAYRKLHKGTEAYQAFREAIDKNEKYAPAYYELGRIFQTQKNADVYTDYFQKAVDARPDFAPALYELYEHHLYQAPQTARDYFLRYRQHADQNLQQEYEYVDILYLTEKYDSAIALAKNLISREQQDVQPRLYKLIAYSTQSLKDTATAIGYMQQYFQNEVDSNLVVKDFETMGTMQASSAGQIDSALYYLAEAANRTTDSATMRVYYQQLAAMAKKTGNPAIEAKWLGKYYMADPAASNVALFNWGLSAYKAQDYQQADTVFGLYAAKYPEQGFGFYWRARANAAIDTSMELGLAVPHYQQLIQMLDKPLDSLSDSDRKWLVEANMYLASYATNTQKDYPLAVQYFQKVVEVDPANTVAPQYIELLERNIEASKTATAPSTGEENASPQQ